MSKRSKVALLTLYCFVSCSVMKSSTGSKHNFFAIPFKTESPVAIRCDDFEKKCDTSFYITDSIILNLIDSRINKLKISSNNFSDARIKFKPTNKHILKEICVDIAGKIQIGNICYERDSLILNKLLSYLPKYYR